VESEQRSLQQVLAEAIQAKERFSAAKDADSYRQAVDAWRLIAGHPRVTAERGILGEVLAQLGTIYLAAPVPSEDATDEAIRCLAEASQTMDNPAVTLALGQALADRYDQHGDPDDLEAAIERLSHATRSPEVQDLGYCLSRLALMFIGRFRRSGNITDLTAAVRSFSAAERAAPPGSPEQLQHMVNLGRSLLERGGRLDEPADLSRAIEVLLNARALASGGSVQLPKILTALGAAYATLGRYTGRRSDLDAAVDMNEEAVQASPAGFDQSELLANLGTSLLDRHKATGDRADLERAAGLLERSLETALPGTRPHASRLHNLAVALASGAADGADTAVSLAEWRRAAEYYRASWSSAASGPTDLLLSIARDWLISSAHRHDWDEAADAAVLATAEMRDAFLAQGSQLDQQDDTRSVRGVPGLAAFALAAAGRAAEAVTALDQGRARLLSMVLERDRADLAGLARRGDADLAEEYRRLATEIAREEEAGPPAVLSGAADMSSRQRQLRLRMEELLGRIRKVPGYERFRAPVGYPDIAAVAGPAPLVYLLATRFGGTALLVKSASEPPAGILLSGLSSAAVDQQVNAYAEAQNHRAERPQAWSRAVNAVTRWAFDEILGPVTEQLTASRMVLVPCGLLALLPLHAAWCPDPGRPGGRRYLLDEMTIGYAANAQSLAGSRRLADAGEGGSVLVVADPRPTTFRPLPAAGYEASAVLAQFPPDQRLHLQGAEATSQAVTAAMAGRAVWHFACHATAEPHMPLWSHVVLAGDERFTVDKITKLRRSDASTRLAVLSACSSGVIGVEAPDEVVGLPTALLHAGVAGTVATLWPVGDQPAALLSAEFYQRWRGGEPDPAAALRAAQTWLRDASVAELHDRHPELVPAPPPVSAAASRLLATAPTPYADPVQWAAFMFWGA
jgi:CHAT domain-containing protein